VLGYTKLEYGRVDLECTTFSLRRMLDDTIALFGVQAREQNVELRLMMEPGFADGFHGDAGKIETVIGNYVSNALKYAPGGTVEVVARVARHSAEASTSLVWIGVRDHGPGLSSEEQKLLFHKFARGQTAKARGISGTGLGLAICRNVAELLDGKAGVVSTAGQGATFWLEVPLTRASLPDPEPAAPQPQHSPALSSAATALIVDDQEYNRVVLRGIAQRLGYRAEVASCADEVWPLIQRHDFDLVFLDWELPGLSGGDIARSLRQSSHAHDAVIIATTAHDNEEILHQCLEAGMDGFAAKPFDTAQIRAIVAESVARRTGENTEGVRRGSGKLPDSTSIGGLSLSVFDDFAAGDPARAQQAATLYVKTLDEELAALREAIESDEREAVARRAHRLRSHAGLVNGAALNAAAQSLVLAARNASSPEWKSQAVPVFAEAELLKSAILRLAGDTSGAVKTRPETEKSARA